MSELLDECLGGRESQNVSKWKTRVSHSKSKAAKLAQRDKSKSGSGEAGSSDRGAQRVRQKPDEVGHREIMALSLYAWKPLEILRQEVI